METLRSSNIQNEGIHAVKGKSMRSCAIRKPLSGVGNKPLRNVGVNEGLKASFKGTSHFGSKENRVTSVIKSNYSKAKKVLPKEALQDIKELKACITDIESYSSVQIPDNVENIDAEDTNNPQLVSRFVNDIYCYIRKLECKLLVKPNHLYVQSEINSKMRAVLVDWLIQVQLRFKLLQETLYMSICILDRYLQSEKVKRSHLQLAGVTAMFIASKYEEMYAPDVGDFVYITDNTYSKKDILSMEKKILRNLDFNLGRPLPLHFLRRNSKAANIDANTHAVAKYLMELTLTEYDFASCLPSLLAASALYISLRILSNNPDPWTETLKFYSNYSKEYLMPTVKNLCKVIINSEKSKLQAVREKYASAKMNKISTIPQLKSSIIRELAGLK